MFVCFLCFVSAPVPFPLQDKTYHTRRCRRDSFTIIPHLLYSFTHHIYRLSSSRFRDSILVRTSRTICKSSGSVVIVSPVTSGIPHYLSRSRTVSLFRRTYDSLDPFSDLRSFGDKEVVVLPLLVRSY